MTNNKHDSLDNTLLGNYEIKSQRFPDMESIFSELELKSFQSFPHYQKLDKIHSILLTLIQAAPKNSFLLPALIDFFRIIHEKNVLEKVSFIAFELWLNQHSGLTKEENYKVRAKIAGKHIPREEYQAFFPVGMGKVQKGSHIVTAHSSPDLDTTIASFWGWLDAFAARVSDGLHIWNVPPGGAPTTHNVHSFFDLFGTNIFSLIPQNRTSLAVSSMNLVSQKSLIKKFPHDSITGVDHERYQKAVIVIDEQGFFLGNWRSADVEGVRQIQIALNTCLRWIENNLHARLTELFSQETLTIEEVSPFLATVFDFKIKDCDPAKDFSERQTLHLNDYLSKVLDVEQGLNCTFREFCHSMNQISLKEFLQFQTVLEDALKQGALFDAQGKLIENRPNIFRCFKEIIYSLDIAIQSMRYYVDTMGISLKIKQKVLGCSLEYVTLQADFEEIQNKMASHHYLTVVHTEQDDKLFPIGVIAATDLRKLPLGTVSLRDFCNRDEVKIASYLEIISVVDHHRTQLNTNTPPQALIGDAQSCNVLVAEQSFLINDKYSSARMTEADIDHQLKALSHTSLSKSELRLKQRLFLRKLNASHEGEEFIHPMREFFEYLQFLYAILEDTDLLSKVSNRDITCVATLLNRMKSIVLKQEAEIINLDAIPKNDQFAKAAAKVILKNRDLYSLYSKIYRLKEEHITIDLEECAQGKPTDLFSDTKQQNACCRIGQTKIFVNNYPTFAKFSEQICLQWLKTSHEAYRFDNNIDLHIHMISTIPGSEEVYNDIAGNYTHKDEFWIWIPEEKQAQNHLISFLTAFKTAPEMQDNELEVEFLGVNAKNLAEIFLHHFPSAKQKFTPSAIKDTAMAVLKFKAGTVNSRKGAVTPYLPVLVR